MRAWEGRAAVSGRTGDADCPCQAGRRADVDVPYGECMVSAEQHRRQGAVHFDTRLCYRAVSKVSSLSRLHNEIPMTGALVACIEDFYLAPFVVRPVKYSQISK